MLGSRSGSARVLSLRLVSSFGRSSRPPRSMGCQLEDAVLEIRSMRASSDASSARSVGDESLSDVRLSRLVFCCRSLSPLLTSRRRLPHWLISSRNLQISYNILTACSLGQSILNLLSLFRVFHVLPVILFGPCPKNHVVN